LKKRGEPIIDRIGKYLGPGTVLVLAVTLALFVAALFTKGFTHDLLLEVAVFLVSLKLIIMTYRNSKGVEAIQAKLDTILSEEEHLEKVLEDIREQRGSGQNGPGDRRQAGSSTGDMAGENHPVEPPGV